MLYQRPHLLKKIFDVIYYKLHVVAQYSIYVKKQKLLGLTNRHTAPSLCPQSRQYSYGVIAYAATF